MPEDAWTPLFQAANLTDAQRQAIRDLIPTAVQQDESGNNTSLQDQKHEYVKSSQSWTGSETCETGFSASTLGMGLSVSGLEIGATGVAVSLGIAAADITLAKIEAKNMKFESGGLFLGA